MRSGDVENEEEEELRIGADIGLKIKARGRQRFRLQSTRRQVRQKLKYKIIKFNVCTKG